MTESSEDPGRLDAALDRLVARGVLDPAQAGAVLQEYGSTEAHRPQGLRRLLGEIAGYLGASFVVGATLLFLGEQWEALGRVGRVGILAAMAAVLIGAGVAVRRRAGSGESVRRRLASTLLTGAAIATGAAVLAAFDTSADYPALAASAAALVVVSTGYLFARSALGQLGVAAGAYATFTSLLPVLHVDELAVLCGGLLVLGTGWAFLGWRRLLTEVRFAYAIALTFALAGAQALALAGTRAENYTGYALTAIVSAVCFAAYARLREWVVLAGGVVGASAVVPEFLYRVTGGALGASGVMLAAGLTLLAGSLAGLRIRKSADGDPIEQAAAA